MASNYQYKHPIEWACVPLASANTSMHPTGMRAPGPCPHVQYYACDRRWGCDPFQKFLSLVEICFFPRLRSNGLPRCVCLPFNRNRPDYIRTDGNTSDNTVNYTNTASFFIIVSGYDAAVTRMHIPRIIVSCVRRVVERQHPHTTPSTCSHLLAPNTNTAVFGPLTTTQLHKHGTRAWRSMSRHGSFAQPACVGVLRLVVF